MQVSVKGFIYHKTAEKFIDCFDRYGINENTNKFAISDGVSRSFFPDVWAELLVEFFIKNDGRINIADTTSYKYIQKEWLSRVSEIVNKPNQKYFVQNFFIQGRSAAATFAGLHFFKEENKMKWEAVALGDSFLFFIPEYIENIDVEFSKIIYLSSKNNFEFNNYPDFFDSRSSNYKGKIREEVNDLIPGTFYLMTDALSEWFISEKQAAIQTICQWKTQNDFENSIQKLRKLNMHNDDSAILIIRVEGDNSIELKYTSIGISDIYELLKIENFEINSNNQVNEEKIQTQNGTQDNIQQLDKNIDHEQNLVNKTNENKISNDEEILNSKKEDFKKRAIFWEKGLNSTNNYFSENNNEDTQEDKDEISTDNQRIIPGDNVDKTPNEIIIEGEKNQNINQDDINEDLNK